MSLKELLFAKTRTKRTIFFVASDIVLIALSCWLAFLFRFDGHIPTEFYPGLWWFVAVSIPAVISLLYWHKIYSISWTYISIRELVKILVATVSAFILVGTVIVFGRQSPAFAVFPRSTIFISAFMVLLTIGGLRSAKRVYRQGLRRNGTGAAKKILIFGAGELGEQLVRYLLSASHTEYWIIGFIDDDPLKYHLTIHGISVIGQSDDLQEIIKTSNIDELIIAVSDATPAVMRKVTTAARLAGLQKIKIFPSTKDILDEKVSLNHIRDISIGDLLGREPVTLETGAIAGLVNNKKILITGAAGSIGSNLCEQILKFNPATIIGVDFDETGIFYLEYKLKGLNPAIPKKFIIGNICQEDEVEKIFSRHKPDIIFHAAAYKHVPLMEDHPHKAIKNNIFGVKVVCEQAIKHNAEKFIFISTDKAVNPSSVMGMSKRIGEFICQSANQQNRTKFISVRFGNVLDSRGNVIALFKKQIKKGGPVEVTHPDMTRYFMVTAEAVLLVMQAGAMGQGGEVFVLDMGEPIKIIDLAKDIITLSGFVPDKDIAIVFTNPRPGEKLFENILTAEEGTRATRHEKILEARLPMIDASRLQNVLTGLQSHADNRDEAELKNILKQIVGDFQ